MHVNSLVMVCLFASSSVLAQSYGDGLGKYCERFDGERYWRQEVTTDPAIISATQRIYSRGNDEGGRTEGDYETALMILTLKQYVPTNASRALLKFDLKTSISTPEVSHARAARAYFLRAGMYSVQGGFAKLTPFVSGREQMARIDFVKPEEGRAVSTGRGDDVRGFWIQANLDLVTLELTKPGSYAGVIYVQALSSGRFVSDFEYHETVKHKIIWRARVENNGISSLDFEMKQPTTRDTDPHWLDRYLKPVRGLSYTQDHWQLLGESMLRFPPKI